MTLNEVMKDTADAIREKTGSTEKIAPINFAEEIKSISAGGGGSTEGGDHEWVYYDVRNATLPEGQWLVMMATFSTLVALISDVNGATGIISGAGVLAMFGIDEVKQRLKYIAIDMDVKQYNTMTNNQLLSFKECETQSGQSVKDTLAAFGITPITKEQFYDLNA